MAVDSSFAQRHLVGYLENIAQRLRAFAVKTTHRQVPVCLPIG